MNTTVRWRWLALLVGVGIVVVMVFKILNDGLNM